MSRAESERVDVDELDLTEVEREICRLPDVSIVRLVAEPDGRVTEAHVVAHPGKHPKQIVRDVQSIALASFGLELDRRIISVVQLGGDALDETFTARSPVRRSSRITAEASGLRSLVRVTLALDDDEAVGFAEGSIATTARHRLVALATVDALRQLEPAAECVDVDHAEIVRIGAHDVAVVTVVFVIPPAEQLVSGSAIVRPQQEADAVARAVLDATNRRLAYVADSVVRPIVGAMAPQAVTVSFRLGGDDGVSVEARASGGGRCGELGFETRRVAGRIEDEAGPTTS